MAILDGLLLATMVAVPAQVEAAGPDVPAMLEAGRDAELLEYLRLRPDDGREALDELLGLSARAEHSDERVRRLAQARHLADIYETAWSDPFLVRRVRQFTRWTRDERMERLEADSLRIEGNAAYRTEGAQTAIELWERALTKLRALDDVAGQAAVLGNLGAGYYALGRHERALRYHARALALAEEAGDHRTRGNALGNIAAVHEARGELALAAEFYGRALEVRPLSGDAEGEAADLNNLALVRAHLGDPRGAEEQLRRALTLNRRKGRAVAAAHNLTNLGNLIAERGEYDAALDLYEEALDVWRSIGDRQGEALALENVGRLHLRWGDYPAALAALDGALAVLAVIGPPGWRAEVRADIAATRAAMGELQAALDELERAEAEVEAGGDEGLDAMLVLRRADLLADLNEDRRAADLYQRAEAAFARLDDPAGQADARQGLGYMYLSRGDLNAAEDAFTRALRAHEALEDPRPTALSRVLLGDVRRLRGDATGARQIYQLALASQVALGDRVAEALTLGALADLDREVGALTNAVTGYREALARIEEQPVQPIRWQLRLGLGLTLREQGRLDEATAELREAVGQVERTGAGFVGRARRYRYFEDKWDVYGELARTEVARARYTSAFEVSERMRARELIDLLARGRTSPRGGSREGVREEQTLRRRIGEFAARLSAPFQARGGSRGVTDERGSLERVGEALLAGEAEYEGLLDRVGESDPQYASLVRGDPADAGEVQAMLPHDAALIEYLVSDAWTLAFVVRRGDIAAVELPIGRTRLRELIRFLHGTLRPGPSDAGDDLWRTPLRTLHQQLFAPLKDAGYLRGVRLLVVAPHAELHYVPFAALLGSGPRGEAFLVESYDVAYVPSASAWSELSRREGSRRGQGLLAMAPLPESLGGSLAEVRAIGRDDPGAQVLVGPEATEARFRVLAPDRGVLHLATSGTLNSRNPLFSYVRLRPGEGGDGRLEVHEVFDLRLSADLVVLSACETGLGSGARQEVPPGDDWVGLVRAFLFAGARSVVASLWPVEDAATASLMVTFYDGVRRGRSKAQALGDAQRALIRSERSSPYYWAAFGLTGAVGPTPP